MVKKEFSEETVNLLKGFTLENIERFGKANSKAILGKLLGTNPDLKTKIPLVMKEIEKIEKEFSRLSKKEFAVQHKKYTAHLTKPIKKDRGDALPELKDLDKPYVFRFEPSPSGPLHLGNVMALLLNSEYAKKYNGTLVLRIADTDPTKVEPTAYDLIETDVQWITGVKYTLVIQSDRMDDYYRHAKVLLKESKAYVCTCEQEVFREFIQKKEACPCRELVTKEQMKRWDAMFTSYDEGEAVLRIKTDLKHKNPAVRDWPAFRITEAEHPRQGKKYRVWPLMNFAVAIDDHEYGLTHVIRGKDHVVNMERQKYIYQYFDWWIPEFIHTGRINFEGLELSKSSFREGIQSGKYDGWDDLRLPTVAAFRRRAFKPEAFAQYVRALGPSKVDKTVRYEEFMQAIYTNNRRLIEAEANRYFFVEDPVPISVVDFPKDLHAEVPVHPDFPKRGVRKFHKAHTFFVEKKDKEKEMARYRLMHLANIVGNKKKFSFISKDPDAFLRTKAIHWLPDVKEETLVKVCVKTLEGKEMHGLAEKNLEKIKEGTIVQFERKFFAVFNGIKNDEYVFTYMHK